MDLSERRDLYNGFGDSLARAFELACTPALFGLLGWWLDRRFDTAPVFLLSLVVTVFGYVSWRMWNGYVARMRAEESKLPGQRRLQHG